MEIRVKGDLCEEVKMFFEAIYEIDAGDMNDKLIKKHLNEISKYIRGFSALGQTEAIKEGMFLAGVLQYSNWLIEKNKKLEDGEIKNV